MTRSALVRIVCVGFAMTAITACGGGGAKKKPEKPKPTKPKVDKPKAETEADRDAKRLAAAQEIVPEGSNCMPAALKPAELAPSLELGAVDGSPVVCAIDTDQGRLLGPVACWSLDIKSGEMTYRAPAPLPGRGFAVRLDGEKERCARGYCLPDDALLPTPPIVHIAWSHGGDKVAVAIPGSEPEIHIFGAADKAHQGVIKPKATEAAEKAMQTDLAGILFVGDVVAALGSANDAGAPVYLFKTDGTPVGAVERFGGKAKGPVSVKNGSASVFGDGMIALNEDALATVTTIDVKTGQRAKLVRKAPKTKCKQKDIDALLAGGGEKASDKCKTDYAKHYEPLIGGLLVQGKNNHLVLLRGERYGELAVVDAKTLVENRHYGPAWCEEKASTQDDPPPPEEAEPAAEE
jgi:hypothetical protein